MTKEIKEVRIEGNNLMCPVCGNKLFWERKTKMNTGLFTFLGLDWADKSAENQVCSNCGYVFWFLK